MNMQPTHNRRIGGVAVLLCLVPAVLFADAQGPVIDVWYGSEQTFGHLGIPQKWANILGNVSDEDGVTSLTYTLNGGSFMDLGIGPDNRRLESSGDFNVEILRTDLLEGSNDIVITATDGLGNQSNTTVMLEYIPDNFWPKNYTVDWSTVSDLTDAVYPLDGLWTLENDSIRTVTPGYDRLLVIGDIYWIDYEVTVPITVHSHDPGTYGSGVGIILRWKGHTDWGGWQPVIGWNPIGASGWYDFGDNGGTLTLKGDNSGLLDEDTTGWHLDFGVEYIWKMRVETEPEVGYHYRLKVWDAGTGEPAEWMLNGIDNFQDLADGSFRLAAHHADVSFGDITVTPLGDVDPPLISNVDVIPSETSALITWSTDEPATSEVDYGLTPDFEGGTVTNGQHVTDHEIRLESLEAETTYHFQLTSRDPSINITTTEEDTFYTLENPTGSGIVSDDFNATSLDTELWTWHDPLGGSTLTMTGSQISIDIPAGDDRDIWTIGFNSPRIMQPANDVDFMVESKFDSPVELQFQGYGILIQENETKALRFDFYYDGLNMILYSAALNGNNAYVKIYKTVENAAPIYMRVHREGNIWTAYYSYNGDVWYDGGSFQYDLSVNDIGPFIATASPDGHSAPSYTGLADYFKIPTDRCPDDPDKFDPGFCGCGVPDTDTDGDGLPDCLDECPDDPNKTEPGICGCGVPDEGDQDGDGVLDCVDLCPDTPTGSVVDETGCPPAIISETMEEYNVGDDPDNWLDTDANNSLSENNSLFKVYEVEGEKVFGTTSTLTNIHSHYIGTGSAGWTAYEYTGRMRKTASDSGFGVTFLSSYPNTDLYYRLRSYNGGSFHISNHGVTITGGISDSGVIPLVNTWYKFKIQVRENVDRTEIKAMVWPQGGEVPGAWQIDCWDDSASRLTYGTIGAWAMNSGSKYWDDLEIRSLDLMMDTDGDGTPDNWDSCPNDPEKIEPGVCGCGVPDIDTDEDGTLDCNDACPEDPEKIEPGACGCGVPDTDMDEDGTPDCIDGCPDDPDKIEPGTCGCGVPDTDTDEDGTPDCIDGCPDDPNKTEPGACGCGVPDTDTDEDGTPDCIDGCPDDPEKIEPGVCGCGVPDIDTDEDGTFDCNDLCPNDPNKIDPGVCGCGEPDEDTDGDLVMDCVDNCVGENNPGQEDTDGDGVGDPCDQCPNTIPGAQVDENGCPAVLVVDFDADGDVDNTDFDTFQSCATGPGIPQNDSDMQAADLDLDGDVDQADFAVFQRCFSGTDTPADVDCIP